ncbi:sperm-associated antigen 4 protein-like [Athene noctua]|uniref:sperm-associated antigen 4 protein-like n=1 Tax=Athene noctua TaxID=126797 RepID=UPI003EBA1825
MGSVGIAREGAEPAGRMRRTRRSGPGRRRGRHGGAIGALPVTLGLPPNTSSEAKDGLAEEEVSASRPAARSGSCNLPALWFGESPDLELLQEVAQLRHMMSSRQKAVSKMALEVARMSDWALGSSGAAIDVQRSSETFTCRENWRCSIVEWLFRTKPGAILEPDMSPGNCWPLQGDQGQVVIRLPARVRLTAVTVQHIYKEVSPSGTVISAPRDVAVFGLDVDGEEEVLLLTFTYDVTKEAIQTFPLKTAPFPRAFSYVKFLVKSNWGNPQYTCIYRLRVHGLRASAGTS